LVLVLLSAPAARAQGVITTVAGSTWVFRGDGGPGTDAPLGRATGVAVDTAGAVYATDPGNCLVVKTLASGILRVVAGNGICGYSGDGGPATAASLKDPWGVAVDAAGNLYIVDTGNVRIRKVTPAGTIATVAGGGYYLGDGGPATSTSLGHPEGVAVDAAGNLYIADNYRIRKVSPSGIISTVAGNGQRGFSGDSGPATGARLGQPAGLAVDAAGNLYIADYGNQRIRRVSPAGIISTVAGNGQQGYSGDGGPATSASLQGPWGVAVDAAGNLYIADQFNDRIRRVSPSGIISTVAGNGQRGYSGDGGPATSAALSYPAHVAVDAAGNLFIADQENHRIRKVSAAGIISTVAGNGAYKFSGDGGPATAASLNGPRGVAVDAAGNMHIAGDGNQRIRRVTPAGGITTVAGNGSGGFSGDGGPATSASLSDPFGVAVDAAGNLYIADTSNYRVRKVSPSGIISTVAGNGVEGFSGDGGPATSASLSDPFGVAVDAAGDLYIAHPYHHRVRKVSPSGIITTVAGNGSGGFSGDGGPAAAASLNEPLGVAVDAAGNLYIADRNNYRVRKVSSSGIITTVAGNGGYMFSGDGGPATSASLAYPSGVAVDAAGNLYIADMDNHRIRKVAPAGAITTVAGKWQGGYSGDGGPATSASLAYPSGVAVDAAGNLYIADAANDRIRKVLAVPPAFGATPSALTFSAPAGIADNPAQTIVLSSTVPGLAWVTSVSTGSGGAWLSITPAAGRSPSTIWVLVDASNLVPGAYEGAIQVSVPVAVPSVISIAVKLTVTAALPRSLLVEPGSLTFQMQAGPSPPEQVLRITNSGAGTLRWTATATTATGTWLKLGASAGSTPASLAVRVDPTGLPAGNYTGMITVQSADTGQTLAVPVSLLSSPPAGVMLLSQTSMAFRAVQGGGTEPPQVFGVLNVGSGAFSWLADSSASWLQVSPISGESAPGAAQASSATVSVDPRGLAVGSYVGFIRVISAGVNNSPQRLRVDLRVFPSGSKLGAVVRPTALIFSGVAGACSPGSQDVSVANLDTGQTMFGSQVQDGDWVIRVPDNGIATADSPGRIVVQPVIENLAPGPYLAALNVATQTAEETRVDPVRLFFLVSPAGTVSSAMVSETDVAAADGSSCVSSKLDVYFGSVFSSFPATMGWGTPILVIAKDNCGTAAAGGTAWLSFTNGDPPLELKDLKDGRYLESWRPGKDNPSLVTVTARVRWRGLEAEAKTTANVGPNPNPKGLLSQGGVLLAAGYRSGPVAPGSIVSLFGQNFTASAATSHSAVSLPLPTKLGGVRVLIGEKEAPLFYVGSGQVNAQVPAELPADRRLQVQVETDGVLSAPEPLLTVTNQPGIFTLDPKYGKQQGAILIANTDRLAMRATPGVPSEPVGRGGYISIFCTGLGATEPAVPSGEGGPSSGPPALVKLPVSVTIGGQPAAVSFAGLAPGLVGVYQVNALVPAGVTPGDEVPVVITQGGAQSNTVTIAVR
jgi:uncharacterized protein (TIGR03437 family)